MSFPLPQRREDREETGCSQGPFPTRCVPSHHIFPTYNSCSTTTTTDSTTITDSLDDTHAPITSVLVDSEGVMDSEGVDFNIFSLQCTCDSLAGGTVDESLRPAGYLQADPCTLNMFFVQVRASLALGHGCPNVDAPCLPAMP
jgi:hypothetical protein